MKPWIKIDEQDNVIIALKPIAAATVLDIDGQSLTVNVDIPQGHKIALQNLEEGSPILKYGHPIGKASSYVAVGDHVHVHNVVTGLGEDEAYAFNPQVDETIETNAASDVTVNVYQRSNGEVGIRNELWIVPTVGCVNGIAENIVREFSSDKSLNDIDGIHAFTHPYGCSQMGDDHQNTKETLQNIVRHPNAGGILVLGLGCENNQIDAFKETLGDYDADRVKFLITQNTEDEIEEGIKLLEEIYEVARLDKRSPQPLTKLRIGLECGGSDGLSGITANPMLGVFSDWFIGEGGTTVLTEVPEMFGGETILMDRCGSRDLFDKTVQMVNGFKQYYRDHGQVIYENPSPGNKKGGITTLEDKSLGCIQKSGNSPVADVLKHNQRITKPGLNLLSAPGNDLVATTALAASGCQLVLFTTGRGTPFGGFVPTMKVSTNTAIYEKKKRWIDFNAGQLVDGKTMETLAGEFKAYVISVIEGDYVNNEKNNIRDIAIFKSGVTL